MKVYKFGGASVRDAAGIRNLAGIVSGESEKLVIVVSALGKTTNEMEKVLQAWLAGNEIHVKLLDEIHKKHTFIIEELFEGNVNASKKLDDYFTLLSRYLESEKRRDYDYCYDQVVSFGEIWSTIIVQEYLQRCGLHSEWVDIRSCLVTDDSYRNAGILWEESTMKILTQFNFHSTKIFVTQGFIGGTESGSTTTLGREGSDYTAALLANMLNAEYVVVWKDVPGILNADPDWLPDAIKLDEISYKEAVEMTFSGAKVIHPKTIKPLHNKNIPLHVRSFLDPGKQGTIIKADATLRRLMPFFIRKEDQILITIVPRDFSFVMGEKLGMIFQHFIRHGIKVNLVEASAVSLDVCVDDEKYRVDAFIENIQNEFTSVYNDNVEMITVRHYTREALDRITLGRDILLEQKTRTTARFVVRK